MIIDYNSLCLKYVNILKKKQKTKLYYQCISLASSLTLVKLFGVHYIVQQCFNYKYKQKSFIFKFNKYLT